MAEIRLKQSKLLLVEGKDEELFFDALLRRLEITSIQTFPYGGKTNLRKNLSVIKNAHSFENVTVIGIVRDSDGNSSGAFDSVCSALRHTELPTPSEPLILRKGNPSTLIMVMPPKDVGTNRMLEDMCLEAVKDDPATICVDNYFACLHEQSITHRNGATAKAHLHAFLASRDEPDLRLGEAAQKGYWPWDHPAFDRVKDFIQQIASE